MFLPFSRYIGFLLSILICTNLCAQVDFSVATEFVSTEGYRSGITAAIVDVNNDGRDDIVRVTYRGILEVHLAGVNQDEFYKIEYEAALPDVPWSIAVGNIDNEGPNEIVLGTVYRGGYIFKLNTRNERLEIMQITARDFYSQGSNLVDINNDGFLDWFINDDESINDIFLNDNGIEMIEADDFIDMKTATPSDNSGNYSTDWIDIDDDGDLDFYQSKCRSGALSNKDPRRINQLFINDGDNNFTEKATEYGIAFGSQSWASNFGDLDNDGDLDAILVNHIDRWNLLENVKNDTFVERNARIDSITGFANQCLLRDFDNNGFLDILVTGANDYLWFNQGNWSFIREDKPFLYFSATNFSVGDVNHDGFWDIYTAYSEGFNDKGNVDDAIYVNDTNDNNWIGFKLVGTASNKSAVGAKIKLYSETIGAQMRNVRSGESYGMMNSLYQIFGLGQDQRVDSIKVYWPSGHMDTYTDLEPGSYYTLTENVCSAMEETIAYDNAGIICDNDSIALVAPTGSSYVWSNGEDTQEISIDRWGYYQVEVGMDSCSQPTPGIIINPNRVDNENIFIESLEASLCAADGVQLSAIDAKEYQWSTGEDSQQIIVSAPGVYSLEFEDHCGNEYMDEISIDFLDEQPVAFGDTVINVLGEVDDAILTARGNDLKWYQSANDNEVKSRGDTLQVPNLQESTTFYVTSESSHTFETETIGESVWQGNNMYHAPTLNGGLYFHVREPSIISSVDIMTDTAGIRIIKVLSPDDDLIFEKEVDLSPGHTTITIDLHVDEGIDYLMTTDTDHNLETFGFKSPFLIRNNERTAYPYRDSDLLWITNSSFGEESYPYFYNWKIKKQDLNCVSKRIPVVAFVDFRDATLEASADLFSIFPNPVVDQFTIDNKDGELLSDIYFYDILGRNVKNYREVNSNVVEMNLEDLNAGQYLVRIDTKSGSRFSYRIVKL